MHFFDMCRTERRRLFNISICGRTVLIAVCVLAMGVLTFINEDSNIKVVDNYFYSLFCKYFTRGTFYQLLLVPVGYYIMYGICTDLEEKMSFFFVTRSNINAYIAAKFVVGILYAFLMFELTFNIFCICGTNILKIVDYSYYSGGSDVYEDVLKINPYLYFELRIFIASLIMSLFVGVGMFVTVFFGNKYIGALSAFLSCIIINKVEVVFDVNELFFYENIVEVGIRPFSSAIASVGAIAGVTIASLFVVYILYYNLFRRKLSGE